MKCNQQGPPPCPEPAAFRFTWPGKDEQGICALHAPKLKDIANALGLHLQLIPIEPWEFGK